MYENHVSIIRGFVWDIEFYRGLYENHVISIIRGFVWDIEFVEFVWDCSDIANHTVKNQKKWGQQVS